MHSPDDLACPGNARRRPLGDSVAVQCCERCGALRRWLFSCPCGCDDKLCVTCQETRMQHGHPVPLAGLA